MPLTRSSTCAHPANTPSITCPARSIARCSTTRSARAWARCTSGSRRSTPRRKAQRWCRETSRATSRSASAAGDATGAHWSTAGAAASARPRWPTCCARSAGTRRRWRAATVPTGARSWQSSTSFPRDSATGSGKSRLLEALAARGAQVLDLERLACHRGSLLGQLPGEPQPSQKLFDSLVWNALKGFDPANPVHVEAESKKIGQLQVPAALLERMRAGACLRLEVPEPERVRFLIVEYKHFLIEPAALKEKLACLTPHYGRAVIDRWLAQADSGAWPELVTDLLHTHYDPSYLRATTQNYLHYDSGRQLFIERLDEAGIAGAAAELSRSPV